MTSSLPRKCSTTELQQQCCIICANLPRGWSGRRDSNPRPLAWKANALPTELLPQKLSVGGDGFEPPKSKTADLQSAPFGHSGIRPYGGASLRRVLRLSPVSVPSESPETPVFREIPVSLQGFEDDKITHYLQIRKHYLPKSAVSGENYPLPPAEKVCKRAKSASKVQSIF